MADTLIEEPSLDDTTPSEEDTQTMEEQSNTIQNQNKKKQKLDTIQNERNNIIEKRKVKDYELEIPSI